MTLGQLPTRLTDHSASSPQVTQLDGRQATHTHDINAPLRTELKLLRPDRRPPVPNRDALPPTGASAPAHGSRVARALRKGRTVSDSSASTVKVLPASVFIVNFMVVAAGPRDTRRQRERRSRGGGRARWRSSDTQDSTPQARQRPTATDTRDAQCTPRNTHTSAPSVQILGVTMRDGGGVVCAGRWVCVPRATPPLPGGIGKPSGHPHRQPPLVDDSTTPDSVVSEVNKTGDPHKNRICTY